MESLLAVLVVYGVCIFIYFANEMHHSKLIEDLPELRAKLDPRLKIFDSTLMSFCGGTPGHRTSGIHHDFVSYDGVNYEEFCVRCVATLERLQNTIDVLKAGHTSTPQDLMNG